MKAAVLFTGGKDSTYATYLSLKRGLEVKYLITMFPKNPYSWMFHSVNIEATKLQAEAMGIKQIIRQTPGEKESELRDLKEAIEGVRKEIEGIVSGSISSSYQKNRIDLIARELGLVSLSPLWGSNPIEILYKMTKTGFEIIITSVSAQGFDQSWLGRRIDEGTIEDLEKLSKKYGINPSGEGGEYESFVLDAPLFKKRIEAVNVEKIWTGTNGYLLIKEAKFVEK
ncbi:MAG: diphthine--ammonia ligase [Candidatus Hadarchaeum sp.]|uniref:diphthine--ammonia ligase n=1 Tax=Candidatus Hadarchaeum sp. TaxID=2883567 RepID=UPI003D14E034